MQRLIASLLLSASLYGCATPQRPTRSVDMPELRLAPASLGGALALQQRLEFEHAERRDRVDALLEVDDSEIRLALHRAGQSLLVLRWDGQTLQQTRAPGVPEAIRAERVLTDLGLVFWPLAAVRAALPEGWELRQSGSVRELLQGRHVVVRIVHETPERVTLEQRRLGYRLRITSRMARP